MYQLLQKKIDKARATELYLCTVWYLIIKYHLTQGEIHE